MVMSLNDLQEECRPVLHWLGEDLQQVAFVIKVHQDMQLLELRESRPHTITTPLLLAEPLTTSKSSAIMTGEAAKFSLSDL